MSGRTWLALAAFCGHAPGLWLLGRQVGEPVARTNRWALAATLGAMLAGGLAAGGWGVLVTWLVGHFAWGSYLARAVYQGRAGQPRRLRAG